jgi:hypothetical protein
MVLLDFLGFFVSWDFSFHEISVFARLLGCLGLFALLKLFQWKMWSKKCFTNLKRIEKKLQGSPVNYRIIEL